MKTYLQQLDELPPWVCVALARTNERCPKRITLTEISEYTHWPIGRVRRVSKLKSWATLSVADADVFRAACGITRDRERRHKEYLARWMKHRVGYAFRHLDE